MKIIGLLGGMSWESSLEYYRLINEGVKARMGGLHSAHCILYSVDFAEIEQLQTLNQWEEAASKLSTCAQRLERAGSECIVLCTNTMHKVAPAIQAATHIPLLHIADATAGAIQRANLGKIGLLGTRFTMQESFYKEYLEKKYGFQILIPGETDRAIVDEIIYKELVMGFINPVSRRVYRGIIEKLQQTGAQGVILGCTEIELLVRPEDSAIPIFPTTAIHAAAAVDFALQ